jgi:Isoleucyl-tRNA synthetase
VWGHIRKPAGAPDSVHLAAFPLPDELISGTDRKSKPRIDDLNTIVRTTREEVLKQLEIARQDKRIGAPLEAQVQFGEGHQQYPLLSRYVDDLPALFIVSQVKMVNGSGAPIQIERADGRKCERCWKYTTDVGSHAEYPTICAPCAEAVEEIVRS